VVQNAVAYQAISQYTCDELLGQNHRLLNSGTHPKEFFHEMYLTIASGRVWHGDICNRAKDGSLYWVNTTIVPNIGGDGKPFQYAAIRTDISERKRAEQVMLDMNAELKSAKAVAEKASLAKSNFLSRMSHELRTPMNAILGFAQLLEISTPPLTVTQMASLHQILKAGWYLLELMNEILELTTIESGNLKLSLESVSLIDVIHECQALIEPQVQKSGIHINVLQFDHSWFANADRIRVKEVLINLLSNAIKYNREHGTVEVKCTERTPERIRISVKDSGAGLPPEKLVQLFQPFNRLGQENGLEEGTGIGLAITKQLVELMGGAIGVESTVGVGSEFWFELIREVTPQFVTENTLTSYADRSVVPTNQCRLNIINELPE
jgi:PAS domain S-box-containing protein